MNRFSAIRPILALLAAALLASAAPAQAAENDITSSSAIVREMNLARQNPMQYAVITEEMRANFQGDSPVATLSGEPKTRLW